MKWTIGEHRIVSFENILASDEGEQRDWIKDIHNEINTLTMKGIDIDKVFSVLVKIMKKVKSCVDLIGTELN